MQSKEKKITIEWVNENKKLNFSTNPIQNNSSNEKLSIMVEKILDEELPMMKNNSLLYNLVLYTIIEKMQTVQNVQNVLSCIKEHKGKIVNNITFKNGEVYIQCSI